MNDGAEEVGSHPIDLFLGRFARHFFLSDVDFPIYFRASGTSPPGTDQEPP